MGKVGEKGRKGGRRGKGLIAACEASTFFGWRRKKRLLYNNGAVAFETGLDGKKSFSSPLSLCFCSFPAC